MSSEQVAHAQHWVKVIYLALMCRSAKRVPVKEARAEEANGVGSDDEIENEERGPEESK